MRPRAVVEDQHRAPALLGPALEPPGTAPVERDPETEQAGQQPDRVLILAPELDELVGASTNGKQWIASLQLQERERTGISSLKVGYNKVFGYFIEVTHTHQHLVPTEYTRRQTLKAAERYITEELKTFEDQVLSSRERALAREKHCYATLLDTLLDEIEPLQDLALRLARLDVLCAFAERAGRLNLVHLKSAEREIKHNAGASLVDLGDGVACLEFHSKMNAIDDGIVLMMMEGVEKLELGTVATGAVLLRLQSTSIPESLHS